MNKRHIWGFLSLFIIATVILTLLIPGCGREGPEELVLLCGGGIRPPIDGADMEDEPGLKGRFQDLNPGIRLEANYGPSNMLLGQLKLTERGDLFFPGDDFYIEEARKEGMVHETRTVAWFVPVIMTVENNPHGIESVSDLADAGIRLAVADQRVAAIGRITPEIFRKNGIDFDELDNIEFTGTTAPEIAQQVDLGHVDATIVWRPVAKQYPGDNVIIDINPEKNVISPLVIAVLETSDNKEAALKFADYISSDEGREIFEKFHYDTSPNHTDN